MNRAHWQALAEERIRAAQALLTAQQWSSAYYLAGYAVEFGLKSCILVHIADTGIIFENKNKDFSSKCWTHDIKDLVALAGLEPLQKVDNAANPLLAQNWLIVYQWTETSRYQTKLQSDAEALFAAVTEIVNGVMPWIKSRW